MVVSALILVKQVHVWQLFSDLFQLRVLDCLNPNLLQADTFTIYRTCIRKCFGFWSIFMGWLTKNKVLSPMEICHDRQL